LGSASRDNRTGVGRKVQQALTAKDARDAKETKLEFSAKVTAANMNDV
jgi:hypothetical protein